MENIDEFRRKNRMKAQACRITDNSIVHSLAWTNLKQINDSQSFRIADPLFGEGKSIDDRWIPPKEVQ